MKFRSWVVEESKERGECASRYARPGKRERCLSSTTTRLGRVSLSEPNKWRRLAAPPGRSSHGQIKKNDQPFPGAHKQENTERSPWLYLKRQPFSKNYNTRSGKRGVESWGNHI